MAIVDAAARLMHDKGIAATAVDDVLSASGTGKSQLYHYFDGKQGLTVAVLRHEFERIIESQPSLRDPRCDDLAQWRDEVLRAHAESGCGACPLGVFAGQVGDDPVLRKELADLFDQWHQAIADLVRRAARAQRVRRDVDPVGTGIALLAAVQGGIMLAYLNGDAGPLARALDRVLSELT